MEFELLSRMGEIRKHLGRVLDELGLQARLEPVDPIHTDDTCNRPVIISFQNSDRTAFSPVELALGSLSAKRTLSWEESAMVVTHWAKHELGSNGWVFFECLPLGQTEALKGSQQEIFDAMEVMIRDADVVLRGDVLDRRTEDKAFARAYEHLESVLREKGPTITCERNEGIESYNFELDGGVPWRVAFEPSEAVLYVNGDRVGSCSPQRPDKVADLVWNRIEDERLAALFGW